MIGDLGTHVTVLELNRLVRDKLPNVIFIMETKCNQVAMKKLEINWGLFDNCFTVNSLGRSGGLALLWRNSCNVKTLNYSQSHIHANFG